MLGGRGVRYRDGTIVKRTECVRKDTARMSGLQGAKEKGVEDIG